ncbi:hypothetical protein ACW2Q0_11735 [Nocardia sp. R16R-3T]
MTAVAALLVIAAFAYLIRRVAPRRPSEVLRLERFHAPGPLTERSPSYYENQRQYADLVAIYGHGDVPDPDAGALAYPERAAQRRIAKPSCAAAEPTADAIQASSGELDWSGHQCQNRRAH